MFDLMFRPRLSTMKKSIELPSIRKVIFWYKKPKEFGPEMGIGMEFQPCMNDAPKRVREIPKTKIEEIIDRNMAGKRAVGSIKPPSPIILSYSSCGWSDVQGR